MLTPLNNVQDKYKQGEARDLIPPKEYYYETPPASNGLNLNASQWTVLTVLTNKSPPDPQFTHSIPEPVFQPEPKLGSSML